MREKRLLKFPTPATESRPHGTDGHAAQRGRVLAGAPFAVHKHHHGPIWLASYRAAVAAGNRGDEAGRGAQEHGADEGDDDRLAEDIARGGDMPLWGQAGPWQLTRVFGKEYAHEFPMPDTDVMQQWIDYKAPTAMHDELAMPATRCVLATMKMHRLLGPNVEPCAWTFSGSDTCDSCQPVFTA